MLETEQKAGAEPQLQPLASTIRQALSQCAPKSLAALTLLAGLSAGPASAATITVNASCTLANAITAANNDAATGGCPAGSGADTIVLPAKSIQNLTVKLPDIASPITISGNGSTIKRDLTVPPFRIFLVWDGGGNLTLNSITVSGGLDTIGGGIFMTAGGGGLTLNNSTVSGNSATMSGGGLVSGPLGTVTLNNSTVSGNSATRSGGGLYSVYGTVTLNNSTVSGNSAALGGGIYENTGILTLNNSTLSGNNSRTGGGLENHGGIVTINNSTLSGNSTIYGGGLFNDQGSVALNNSTVSGNSGYYAGGGIYNAGSLSLSRSLVSGNTSYPGAEVYNKYSVTGATVSADNHNIFGHDGTAGVSGFTPGASDIVPAQPLSAILKPLGNNGGLTQTHLLVNGSPAINASPKDADCPATDQRGISRPQGTACDIGAVEVTFCDTAAPTRGCTVNGVANQRCEGTDASDTIIGSGGNDIIRGLGGNDILKGAGGNDKLCGGLGNDRLEGGLGLDQLFGGFGADRLLGGDGDDSLFGEQDNDNLDGGLGADKLNGGPGSKDTCLSDGSDTSKVGCEL